MFFASGHEAARKSGSDLLPRSNVLNRADLALHRAGCHHRGSLSTSERCMAKGIPALQRSWITPGVPASSAWPRSVKASQEHLEHITVLVEP